MNDILTRKIFGVAVFRWAILGAIGLALLAASFVVRERLNLEWNVESLRRFVQSLGLWGPLAYIAILTLRFIVLIPTSILLLAAGMMFGPVYGTLYAGIGLFGSGMWKYGLASIVGRDVMLAQLPERLQQWVRRVAEQKMSAWALAGVCAYPFFPKQIFQFAAILSGMSLIVYVAAITIGGFIQAAIFANIGEAIYSGAGLATATGLFVAALLIPLIVPSWRRWMLAPITAARGIDTPKEPLE
jgi:uncharacterized membrane protein YdjX (TVP38/TMEM64 family)